MAASAQDTGETALDDGKVKIKQKRGNEKSNKGAEEEIPRQVNLKREMKSKAVCPGTD